MKLFYLALAYLALGIAFLGILLPGLPATEFLLLAAWAAGKSSPRLHTWMMNHPMIGPPLKDWKHSGVIRLKTKLMASVSMLIAAALIVLNIQHLPSVLFCLAGMSCGAWWIWSRPSVATESAGDSRSFRP